MHECGLASAHTVIISYILVDPGIMLRGNVMEIAFAHFCKGTMLVCVENLTLGPSLTLINSFN